MKEPTECHACEEDFDGAEAHSYDPVNGLSFCPGCTTTLGDMLKEPDSFLNGQDEQGFDVYHTAETAKAYIDEQLAKGRTLDDKMFNVPATTS